SNLVLRIDRDRATDAMTAFLSTDGGGTWTQIPGTVTKALLNPRVGIFVGGNASSSVVSADIAMAEVRSAAPPAPSILAGPAKLSFSRISGGAVPSSQKILLTNAGTGALSWSVTGNQSWLSVTPASGTTTGALTVSVVPGTLTPGRYDGAITITAAGAANS